MRRWWGWEAWEVRGSGAVGLGRGVCLVGCVVSWWLVSGVSRSGMPEVSVQLPDVAGPARRPTRRGSCSHESSSSVLRAGGSPMAALLGSACVSLSNPSEGCPGDNSGHPSAEPEGSLLHCLYLQLLAAGSEGMTLKEIYTSFASQTRFSRIGTTWRDKVKSHLTTNRYFKVVKARYFLRDPEPEPVPSAPKAVKEIRSLMDLNVEPRASRRSFVSLDDESRQVRHLDTTVSTSPDPSVVVNNEREGTSRTHISQSACF